MNTPLHTEPSFPKEVNVIETFEAGDIAYWNNAATGPGGLHHTILPVRESTGKDYVQILNVQQSLSGTHPQDVEILHPHPHNLRTWICASWLTKIKP